MHRRDLLKAMAAAVPLTVAGRVWAAPKAEMRLLVVFLRGAYDAANVVIPVSSDFYYESRPTLAVPRPRPGAADAALGSSPSNAELPNIAPPPSAARVSRCDRAIPAASAVS